MQKGNSVSETVAIRNPCAGSWVSLWFIASFDGSFVEGLAAVIRRPSRGEFVFRFLNRPIDFESILILLLLVSMVVLGCSMFYDNPLFGFWTKVVVFSALGGHCVLIRRGLGGFPFKLFSLLVFLYFFQRMILFSFDSTYFTYPISLVESDVQRALLFLFSSILLAAIGMEIGGKVVSPKMVGPLNERDYSFFTHPSFVGDWLKISFLVLFTHFSVMFFLGEGIGVLPPGALAWLLRPTRAIGMIFIVNFLLFLQQDLSLTRWQGYFLRWFIVLYMLSIVVSGSRSALLIVPFFYLVGKCILGEMKVRLKYLLLFAAFLPLLSVYVASVNLYREYLQTTHFQNVQGVASFSEASGRMSSVGAFDALEFFSRRLNGFDLLVSAIIKEKELAEHISFFNEVLVMVDTLYPGSLFEHGMDPGLVIPLVFRKIDSQTILTFSKEHMHFLGMSIVYFGWLGGLVMLLLFYSAVGAILFSRMNVFLKLLMAQLLIVYPFETGFLSDFFKNGSETLVMFWCVVAGIHVLRAAKKAPPPWRGPDQTPCTDKAVLRGIPVVG
jgi:hypothetical protein